MLLFPTVKVFQYKCNSKYPIVKIDNTLSYCSLYLNAIYLLCPLGYTQKVYLLLLLDDILVSCLGLNIFVRLNLRMPYGVVNFRIFYRICIPVKY